MPPFPFHLLLLVFPSKHYKESSSLLDTAMILCGLLSSIQSFFETPTQEIRACLQLKRSKENFLEGTEHNIVDSILTLAERPYDLGFIDLFSVLLFKDF